jgi:hypothetical protein
MACASATANPFKLPRSKLPPEPYTNIDHSCDDELLVVYDSPSDERLKGETGYVADVFRLA